MAEFDLTENNNQQPVEVAENEIVEPITTNENSEQQNIVDVTHVEVVPPATQKSKTKDVVKASTRYPYTYNATAKEHEFLKPIVDDLIKFGIVENPSQFVKVCVDFYINYQKVCEENNIKPGLAYPIPNGENGSIAIEHKLLKGSLFSKFNISKLPTL